MFTCALIGDSIAVGVGQARPECETVARVGITSERYITSLLPLANTTANTTIISLGVNDDDTVDTLHNLRQVRAQVRSQTVFWLLPGLKPRVRETIVQVARENGDRMIDTRPEAGRDHLHPSGAGYQVIAAQTYDGAAPYDQSMPVEVAEAPQHMPSFYMAGEPRMRVTYSRLPSQRATRVAFGHRDPAGWPRRLYGMATPRERIRNLRASRLAEGIYAAPAQHSMRMSVAASSRMIEPATHHGAPATGRLPLPPSGPATHASVVRPARTVQACASRTACSGQIHSVRG